MMAIKPPPGQERDLAVLKAVADLLTSGTSQSPILPYKVREYLNFELTEDEMINSLYTLLATGHIKADYRRNMNTQRIIHFVVISLTPKGYKVSGLWDDTALTPAGPMSREDALHLYYDKLLQLEPSERMRKQIHNRMRDLNISSPLGLMPGADDYYRSGV